MKQQRIILSFDKQLSKLAGNKFGRTTYSDQVKGKIDLSNDTFVFVFPNQIDRIASSFIQGFFDELMMTLGLQGIKDRVFVESSIDSLKQFIVDNLGC